MATFALIHGAGDVGWYWHLVEAELRRAGPRRRWPGSSVRRRLSGTLRVRGHGDRGNRGANRSGRGRSVARRLRGPDRLRAGAGEVAGPRRAHDPRSGRGAHGLLDGHQVRRGRAGALRRRGRALLSGRSAGVGVRGSEAGKEAVRSPPGRAVAAQGMAGRPHAGAALSGRPPAPRRPSFAASPGSAWASRPTSSMVVTPLRSAARRSWPTTSRRARPRWAWRAGRLWM